MKSEALDRPLTDDEVEWRADRGTVAGSVVHCYPLIYITARAVFRRLDEAFGKDGWQDHYEETKSGVVCTISIWSDSKNGWVNKCDIGTPGNYEKEKGAYSDSVKRAFVHLSEATRELYELGGVKAYAKPGLNYDDPRAINVKDKNDSSKNYWFIPPSLTAIRDGSHNPDVYPQAKLTPLTQEAIDYLDKLLNKKKITQSAYDAAYGKFVSNNFYTKQESIDFLKNKLIEDVDPAIEHEQIQIEVVDEFKTIEKFDDYKGKTVIPDKLNISKKSEIPSLDLGIDIPKAVKQEYPMDAVNEDVSHEKPVSNEADDDMEF